MIEDREAILKEYFGDYWANPYIQRLMGYDRYHEARMIEEELVSDGVDFKNLKLIDFGCAVGDYGMHFMRLGSWCLFQDFPFWIDFVKFRAKKESLLERADFLSVSYPPIPTHLVMSTPSLAIFSEVLEHLDNPLEVIKDNGGNCEYIFTSSYPYKSDEEFEHKGHKIEAKNQQSSVIKFLESGFRPTILDGQSRLWRKK